MLLFLEDSNCVSTTPVIRFIRASMLREGKDVVPDVKLCSRLTRSEDEFSLRYDTLDGLNATLQETFETISAEDE